MSTRAMRRSITVTGVAVVLFLGFSGYAAAVSDVARATADPQESCIYNLAPKLKSFSAAAGSVNVTVTAPGRLVCPEPAVSNDSGWVVTSAVQNWKRNRGTVRVSVPANQSYQGRTASLLIGGKPFPVSQAGKPCKNVLTFSETYDESLECMVEEGETFCDVMGGGSFGISGKMVLTGIDVGKFNGDTEFSFDMGEFSVSVTLGDDVRYKPGKTSAQFSFADFDYFDRLVTYLRVRLSWTTSQLTITISGSTPEYLSPVVAGDFVGMETGSIQTSVPVSIIIDSGVPLVAEGVAVIKGQVTTNTETRGWDEYDVSSVGLNGKATLCE